MKPTRTTSRTTTTTGSVIVTGSQDEVDNLLVRLKWHPELDAEVVDRMEEPVLLVRRREERRR